MKTYCALEEVSVDGVQDYWNSPPYDTVSQEENLTFECSPSNNPNL